MASELHEYLRAELKAMHRLYDGVTKDLTDEQIKKIDTVLAEEFRTRRMRQLRDGGAKDPRGPGQLRGDGDAPPAKAAEPPAGTEAPKGK